MLKKAFKAALIIIGVIGIWHIYLIFTLASADIIVKKRSSSGMLFSNVYYYAIQNNRAIPVSEPMLTAVGKKNVRSESYYSKDAVPCYCVGDDLLHGETVCYTKSQLELKAHPIRKESPELTAEDRQNIKSIADYTEELFPEMCDSYVVFYYIPHDGDVYFYYDRSYDEKDIPPFKFEDGNVKEIGLGNGADISYIYFR